MRKLKVTKTDTKNRYVTQEVADSAFIASLPKKPEGANTIVEKFLVAIHHTQSTMRSFTVNEVLTSTRPFDLDPMEVKHLWNQWVDVMVQLNKVSIVPTCYDDILVVCA